MTLTYSSLIMVKIITYSFLLLKLTSGNNFLTKKRKNIQMIHFTLSILFCSSDMIHNRKSRLKMPPTGGSDVRFWKTLKLWKPIKKEAVGLTLRFFVLDNFHAV